MTQQADRPSMAGIYMSLATMLATRSTCRRMHVGAVIVSADHRAVYATGYNGNAPKLDNDCDRHGEAAVGSCGCVHAEESAVIACSASAWAPKHVFTTHLPCVACAKRIISMGGVKLVYYANDYRIRDSLALFDRVNIQHAAFDIQAHGGRSQIVLGT